MLGCGTASGKVAYDKNEYSQGEGSEMIIKGLEFVRKNPRVPLFQRFLRSANP